MEEKPHNTGSDPSNDLRPPAYVTLILDETGSMRDCKGAAIAGVNAYLATLREMATPVRFTLTLFNSGKLEVRHRSVPATQVPELTDLTYQPADTTPLYDAVGRTLATAAGEASPESKKLCVILTDGLENASQEYSREGIMGMIKEYQGQGWIFVYLGADHDAWAAGGDLGIAGDNRIQFCRRDMGDTFDRLGEATSAYLSNRPDHAAESFWKGTDVASPDKNAPGCNSKS